MQYAARARACACVMRVLYTCMRAFVCVCVCVCAHSVSWVTEFFSYFFSFTVGLVTSLVGVLVIVFAKASVHIAHIFLAVPLIVFIVVCKQSTILLVFFIPSNFAYSLFNCLRVYMIILNICN